MNELKYKALYEFLMRDIMSGKYNAENPIPSIKALMMRFGLSKNTVLRTLDELKSQGLISRSQGRASTVTKLAAARKIGLIVPGIVVSEFFRPVVTTLIRLAQENGYTILFGETYSHDPVERVREARDLAATMIKNHIAGVLYQPFEATLNGQEMNQRILSVLDAKKIPVVLIDRDAVMPPERTMHDLVAVNNVDAGERITRHMALAGARHIAFLTKYSDVPNIECRLRGFLCAQMAFEHKGVQFQVLRVAADDVAFFRRKMRGRTRPDAIVCDSDTTAAVLLQTMNRIGCAVPDDVLVSGFDDVGLATLTTPRLTTIHQPCTAIAEWAFCRLLGRIAHPRQVPAEILLQAPLVVRASTSRECEGKKGIRGRRKC